VAPGSAADRAVFAAVASCEALEVAVPIRLRRTFREHLDDASFGVALNQHPSRIPTRRMNRVLVGVSLPIRALDPPLRVGPSELKPGDRLLVRVQAAFADVPIARQPLWPVSAACRLLVLFDAGE
jgi:hypothetical protein